MDPNTSSALSAVVVLICEALAHIDDEVQYIWRRESCWSKWAYLYLRFSPILLLGAALTATTSGDSDVTYNMVTCQVFYGFMVFGMNMSVWVVDSLLIARVSALYYLSRKVSYILRVMLAAELITMVIACGLSIPKATFVPGCLTASMPRVCLASLLSSVLSQIILFVLTIVHFLRSRNGELPKGSIETILTRDGTWAFGVTSLVNVCNVLVFHFSGFGLDGFGNIVSFWTLVAFSALGCRIQLNLYQKTAITCPEEDSYSLGVLSSINFTHTLQDV
ncbi:hypothetical protein QCA50_010273 [Cerrena zonata]|uniref:DUF6533 domain-containing protein n=1 Tax=Cerrena zonata TaxID=2478898 RepID=A0AAW0G9Q5_9APHY